jgi:DNA polymerase V
MMKMKKIKSTPVIDFYTADISTKMPLPFVDSGIAAGFPSPAEDYIDLALDLNKELVNNPSSTFYGRVKGSSMKDAGIHNGDILVIDKSLEPTNGKVAVCFIDGEFTLKRMKFVDKKLFLVPANEDYDPIEVTKENDFIVWGIVTYIIKKM